MGILSNLKLIIAGVVLIAFLALGGAYKLKSYQLEQARQALATAETTIAVQNTTIQQHQQNRKAQQNSADIQQRVEQQSSPIHQAIEDSTPETLLNEKQKSIADCIVALFRGLLVKGSCGGQAGSDLVPPSGKANDDRAKDR